MKEPDKLVVSNLLSISVNSWNRKLTFSFLTVYSTVKKKCWASVTNSVRFLNQKTLKIILDINSFLRCNRWFFCTKKWNENIVSLLRFIISYFCLKVPDQNEIIICSPIVFEFNTCGNKPRRFRCRKSWNDRIIE